MALLTVEELEVAMGVTFDDTTAARAQYYIDGLSAYVQTKTGVTFSVVADATERLRADAYGVILFTKLPITEITLIHDFATDTDLEPGGWIWDGLEHVTNLCGWQVVDVTYSYGLDAPADVKWAATEAVKRGMLSEDNQGLVLKQVGDVIHQYGAMLPLTVAEQEIFNAYGITEWSIHTAPPPPYNQYSSTFPFDVTRSEWFYSGY